MSEEHRDPEPRQSPPPSRGAERVRELWDRLRELWDRLRELWDRLRASGALKWVAVAAGVLLLVVVGGWFTCGFQGCPDPSSLTRWEPGGAPIILDRNDEQYATLLPVQRELVDMDSLPDHVSQAFIAVEDRRFMDHGGVDVRRVGGALIANVKAGGVAEGGSTITMQLARNAFPDHLPASQRNMRRKIAEARVAMAIENEFEKDEILGLYLNQIYFGNGATGIAAASRSYFGIPPAELAPWQSALLAAMVKAPAHYDPREDEEEALERRNLVLDLMLEGEYLSEEEHRAARETEIEVIPRDQAANADESVPAPWYLEAVRRALDEALGPDLYRTQVRVYTTVDPELQAAAEQALQEQLAAVESGRYGSYRGAPYDPSGAPGAAGSEYLQGAVVVLDVRDGGVLALVGGRNHRHSTFDHALDADRQVGSAFKPFVYGAALAEGLPPSHRLIDAPVSIEIRGSPTYEPSNYDGEFRGSMTAREALRDSRNVPTVRLAQEIGTDDVADFARDAGIEEEISEGPSMALGTVALSPMELARAYTTFAGLGRAVEPRLIRRVESSEGELLWESQVEEEQRIDPAVAYVLNDMLQDVIDGGTGSGVRGAGFRGPAAGKTGTTQDAADVWFVGYTPEVVGVVWMGFDQPAPILGNATGGGLAAPIWGRMMARGGRQGSEWEMPDGVVRRRACGSAREELFLGSGGGVECPEPAPDTLGFDTLAGDSLAGDSVAGDSLGFDTTRGGFRDTLRIDPSRPDTFRADTTGRDPRRPDPARPDTARPDTLRPDTVRPDTVRPDTVRPDTVRRPPARPDTTPRPRVRQPPARSDTTRPDTMFTGPWSPVSELALGPPNPRLLQRPHQPGHIFGDQHPQLRP